VTTRSFLVAIGLAVVAGLLLVVGAVGACISLTTSVDDAKAWCEEVAVDLEAWRALNGRYPDTLEAAGLGKDPPSICRSSLRYEPRPDGFSIDFSDILHIYWYYDSKTRAWSRSG